MRIDEKTKSVHFQWERIVQGHALHPFPSMHTLWKASDLVFDVFSHMSKKFQHYRIYQTYHIFYFSCDLLEKIL